MVLYGIVLYCIVIILFRCIVLIGAFISIFPNQLEAPQGGKRVKPAANGRYLSGNLRDSGIDLLKVGIPRLSSDSGIATEWAARLWNEPCAKWEWCQWWESDRHSSLSDATWKQLCVITRNVEVWFYFQLTYTWPSFWRQIETENGSWSGVVSVRRLYHCDQSRSVRSL